MGRRRGLYLSWQNGVGPRDQQPRPLPHPLPTESTAQLPLFGYTVYVVLRVSKLALPGPALLGLNRQHLVLMDPSSQVGRGLFLCWLELPSFLTQFIATPSTRAPISGLFAAPETLLLCHPKRPEAAPPAEPTAGGWAPWPRTQLWPC